MSSISGVGAGSAQMMGHVRPRLTTEQAAKMAGALFQKLDASGQGYLTQADIESAVSGNSSSAAVAGASNVDQLFAKLDGDGDGKVTQDEFTQALTSLADELQTQAGTSRLHAGAGESCGMGGSPPPPPPDDTGFTEDELKSQLEEIGSSDPARASLISSVLENFEAADTNSDGKVSFQEAMAYQQSQSTSATDAAAATKAASANAVDAASGTALDDRQLLRQIERLMHAYGIVPAGGNGADNSASISVAV